MKSWSRFLVPCLLTLALVPGNVHGRGTQTDWSGGPDEAGPLPEFGTRFDAGDLAWRSVAGQLALRSAPRLDSPRDVLIVDTDRPKRLAVADVTGDDFADVVVSDAVISPFDPDDRRGGVYVWQNDGHGSWMRTVITEELYGAWHVDAADLDDDGDLDVIASAFYGEIDPPPPPPSNRNGRYAWFENLDGAGGVWEKRELGELFWGANHVAAGDIDGDGDLDVIGCSTLTDGVYEQEADVVWFENQDGSGETWSQHDVSGDFGDAFEGYPVDVDGDGDLDLIVSGYDRFEWFESLDGSGDSWSRHEISPTIQGAGYFDVGDLDGDGDIDFVGSGINNSVLVAWLNDGKGASWSAFVVGPFFRGFNVDLADLDGDGDLDAVSAKESGATAGQLAWSENLGDGASWNLSYVDLATPSNPWAGSGDVDRDGKPELVAGFEDVSDVGVQVAAYTLTDFVSDGTLRSSILDGGAAPDWGVIAWDADVPEVTSLEVEIRGSDDPEDLGAFMRVPSSGTPFGDVVDPSVRYVQYRVSLSSGGPDASPILREIGIETSGPVGVDDAQLLVRSLVSGVHPNPTRAGAVLTYVLPSASPVSLDIFDASGRVVLHRDHGEQGAGRHQLAWDGRDARRTRVSPGVYFLRLRAGTHESVERLIRTR